MIVYPLTVIYLISLYNVSLFNHSPSVKIPVDRLMHGVMTIAPSHLRYTCKENYLKKSLFLAGKLA